MGGGGERVPLTDDEGPVQRRLGSYSRTVTVRGVVKTVLDTKSAVTCTRKVLGP